MGAKTIFAGLGVGFLYQVLMTGFKGWKDTPEKVFGAPFKAGFDFGGDFSGAAGRRLHHWSAHRVDHVRRRRACLSGFDSRDQVLWRGNDHRAAARNCSH